MWYSFLATKLWWCPQLQVREIHISTIHKAHLSSFINNVKGHKSSSATFISFLEEVSTIWVARGIRWICFSSFFPFPIAARSFSIPIHLRTSHCCWVFSFLSACIFIAYETSFRTGTNDITFCRPSWNRMPRLLSELSSSATLSKLPITK